ncbi:uncharacterized protein JCM15063_004699 [Sporobolomyces koalae]|uniref:uncharacterized protein n=1 Tax=Sporobolomyces koalae TaxID=500713 RepID=UPI00317272E4
MPQGSKLKPPANAHKTKSSTQKKQQPKDPKKGARAIPPKKAVLVQKEVVHRRNTSSHAASIEKGIAASALAHGKLTIMRPVGEAEKKAKEESGKK